VLRVTGESGDFLQHGLARTVRSSLAGLLTVLGPLPNKKNLVVRLRGTGKAKPILFIGHIDVVEALRQDWSMDPFRLTERDGWLYGRGTIDIKDEVADLVTNLIRLKRERYVPDRDIIIALTDDEEGGDDNGAQWLLANRPGWIAAAYAINLDAGGAQMQNGRRLRNPVQTSEKIYATYLLEVTGPGGHSSLPERRNVIYILARGLDRLSQYTYPVRLTETTRGFFDRLGGQIGGETGRDLQAIAAGRADSAVIERVSETPMYNSSMRNTCVATMLEAGHAENALPQRADATVQCRLLPDESPAAIRDTLARSPHFPYDCPLWPRLPISPSSASTARRRLNRFGQRCAAISSSSACWLNCSCAASAPRHRAANSGCVRRRA